MKKIYSPNPRRSLPNRVGDLVELNSGGPHMLVVDILHDGALVCSWLDGTKVVEGIYYPATLKYVF